jgi:hypothetical protein
VRSHPLSPPFVEASRPSLVMRDALLTREER